MKVLYDIEYKYICIEYDLECLLQIMDILEDFYDESESQETKRVIHIMKKNVEAGRKELRKTNTEFDKYLMSK